MTTPPYAGASGSIQSTLSPRFFDSASTDHNQIDPTPMAGNLLMASQEPGIQDASQLRQMALSRWDNEGGAGICGSQQSSIPTVVQAESPLLTNTELVQLRIRVIALENLMIALLVQASDRQLDLVREMATYISPRPGFTHHPLTISAAADMIQLVERASHFRVMPPS